MKPELLLGRTSNLDGTKRKTPLFREVKHGLSGYLQNVLIDEERKLLWVSNESLTKSFSCVFLPLLARARSTNPLFPLQLR